jgi:NNMT/PNMT/TEMT family
MPIQTTKAFAPWDDFDPDAYNSEYYTTVQADEIETLPFFVNAMRIATPNSPVLFFGVGPALHHVFLAAPYASEIHLAEYLPSNRHALEAWLHCDPLAHNWRPFVEYTLACEGIAQPSDDAVAQREALTRSKISALLEGDAGNVNPLGGTGCPPYSTVVSAYCADSATDNIGTWELYMRNIASLVRPGGLLITAALRRAAGYSVGGKLFPSAFIDETDLVSVLNVDFDTAAGRIEARTNLTGTEDHGYDGIVLTCVRRRH